VFQLFWDRVEDGKVFEVAPLKFKKKLSDKTVITGNTRLNRKDEYNEGEGKVQLTSSFKQYVFLIVKNV